MGAMNDDGQRISDDGQRTKGESRGEEGAPVLRLEPRRLELAMTCFRPFAARAPN